MAIAWSGPVNPQIFTDKSAASSSPLLLGYRLLKSPLYCVLFCMYIVSVELRRCVRIHYLLFFYKSVTYLFVSFLLFLSPIERNEVFTGGFWNLQLVYCSVLFKCFTSFTRVGGV